ncbi:MAG: DUF502 domain-containing protein [Planctomycetota bacterium]
MSRFRRTFLTGVAALFPILITVFLLSWLYAQLDRTIGHNVNSVCRRVLVERRDLFEMVFPSAGEEVAGNEEARLEYAEENFPGFVGLSIGIVGVLLVVYGIGLIVRGYVGARLVSRVDGFFERFPVIKSIYPHARQVADFLFGSHNRLGFRRVVSVQYPRRGIYTMGFLTGDGLKEIQENAGQNLVSVFIPTSPAPMTGFVIQVPEGEVQELDMGIEQAVRFCVTAGMVSDPRQRTRPNLGPRYWTDVNEEPEGEQVEESDREQEAMGDVTQNGEGDSVE